MNKRVLVIDDLREFEPVPEGSDVTYAKTISAGLHELVYAEWDEVYLDHDLGLNFDTGDEETIRPAIDHITQCAHGTPGYWAGTKFYVITSNPYGGDMMMQALSTAGLDVTRIRREIKWEYVYGP